jgi:hypothetical protein
MWRLLIVLVAAVALFAPTLACSSAGGGSMASLELAFARSG